MFLGICAQISGSKRRLAEPHDHGRLTSTNLNHIRNQHKVILELLRLIDRARSLENIKEYLDHYKGEPGATADIGKHNLW